MTQAAHNPFPNSDTNKRYYTYSYYLKKTFGTRCVRLPLDAGMTCPNIDGKCSTGGCIYCSERGSGEFASAPTLSVREQIEEQKAILSKKYGGEELRYIAYFQAHTNTYAPLARLKQLFEEALSCSGVIGLSIATRADCLPPDVLAYLAELAERTHLTVELGLQSTQDDTARRINRGHTYADFLEGYRALRAASERIHIGVHLILGLPGEDRERMLSSVREVAALEPDLVKLHLLYVVRGTPLCRMYEEGRYTPLARQDYIALVVDALALLPPNTVIGRLTGDGERETLVAPLWSRDKLAVLNDIDKALYARDLWQGKLRGDAKSS